MGKSLNERGSALQIPWVTLKVHELNFLKYYGVDQHASTTLFLFFFCMILIRGTNITVNNMKFHDLYISSFFAINFMSNK